MQICPKKKKINKRMLLSSPTEEVISLYDIGADFNFLVFQNYKSKPFRPESKKCNCYLHMRNLDLLQQIYPMKRNY